jgi:regulator of protease activity HflC (stomatin/prohibitin superfamily)
VLLREIQLPETLKAAIEAKQRAEQDSLQMQYVLTKEKQEAERKRVEAQGIADFQKIVTQGISEQLLEWKGIEATEKLAASPNTKVIVVGGGKTGLPLILGQ